MLQGALTAVAAKAKEAKAAVGSAVGEIRDAIDNPTYDEHEDDAWSDEEADARVPASTDVPPRADGGGASAGGGPAAAPAGGALAALRARLAAERERKMAEDEEHLRAAGSANPPAEAPPPPSVPESAHKEETHPTQSRVLEPALSPDEDPAETARSAEGRRGADDGVEDGVFDSVSETSNAAARLRDTERALAELATARREDAAKHAEALRIATQNAELATRDLQAQKFETEKKEKELERLRRHLLDMEAEDDEKEERLSSREAEAARRAEGTIAAATEASVSAARAAERDAEILREALAAKDAELANLQLALEHFDDEAESAERRALESAALREKNATLGAELVAERARVAAAQEKVSDAEARATAMEKHAAAADAAAQKSVVEASRARRALQEHAKKTRALSSSADASEQVDRRVVGKLLVTYFQRGQSVDVLELMARVLGVSEADKNAMGLGPGGARRPKGVLGTVASVPGRVVFGALGLAGTVAKVPVAVAEVYTPETETETVADQWVEFLLQQMDAEDGEG